MEIKEIQELIHKRLRVSNSTLTNFEVGSVTYTLTRSIAGAINELYLMLKAEISNSNLLEATADSLDMLGRQHNIFRELGERAEGNVLALNLVGQISIPENIQLIDPLSKQTVKIVESKVLNTNVETRLRVKADDIGTKGNLKGGTALISTQYPNVVFTVGDYRLSNGSYCGGLTKGSDKESDESYRQRIINKNYNTYNGTEVEISKKLKESGLVEQVWYELVAPGVYSIWVDSSITLTQEQLTQLNENLIGIIPAGLYTNVFQINVIPVDLSMISEVSLVETELNFIKSLISIYFSYITNLKYLDTSEISNYINEVTGLSVTISLLSPLPDIYTYTGITYKLNKFSITYQNA